MMLQFSFPRNYFLIELSSNEILLSNDTVADYANTVKVTFSIRNSAYHDTR